MAFDLGAFAPRIVARSRTWESLRLTCSLRPTLPNYGKAMTGASFESGDWLAELLVWNSGEVELGTVRLGDQQVINKHYEVATVADLEAVLDEVVELLRYGRMPPGALMP